MLLKHHDFPPKSEPSNRWNPWSIMKSDITVVTINSSFSIDQNQNQNHQYFECYNIGSLIYVLENYTVTCTKFQIVSPLCFRVVQGKYNFPHVILPLLWLCVRKVIEMILFLPNQTFLKLYMFVNSISTCLK